jgi:hypothetical protein
MSFLLQKNGLFEDWQLLFSLICGMSVVVISFESVSLSLSLQPVNRTLASTTVSIDFLKFDENLKGYKKV